MMQPGGRQYVKMVQGTLLAKGLLSFLHVSVYYMTTTAQDMLPSTTPQVPFQAYIQDHPKTGRHTTTVPPKETNPHQVLHSNHATTCRLEAHLLPKVPRNSRDPLLRDGIHGVRRHDAVPFVEDLVALDARLDVPHCGRAGELDLGLGRQGPGVLGRGEAREDVAGVVCV